MKIYILNNGWLECDENFIINLKNYATKDNKEVISRWIKLPVFCVLIDAGERKILFDCGQNPKEYDRSKRCPYYFEKGQLITDQLSLVGLKPEDIDTVVLSHLHDDHCGNMELFPNALFVIQKDEYDLVKSGKAIGAYKYANTAIKKKKLIKKDEEIIPGITFINLPGHSKGLLGMVVKLKNKTLIFPSDCCDTSENYGPPSRLQATQYDVQQYTESIEKLRQLQIEYNAEIIYSHDFNQFCKLKKAPEFYE